MRALAPATVSRSVMSLSSCSDERVCYRCGGECVKSCSLMCGYSASAMRSAQSWCDAALPCGAPMTCKLMRYLEKLVSGAVCTFLANGRGRRHAPFRETIMTTHKPALWTPGDWNAFFGFGTNILVNLLVLTGLMRFVLKMPDDLVFGRILPATGLMLCLSTMYYAYLAYRLAQRTGRTDVCALPSGVSVPHMFVVVFVIMLPISIKTGDPIKGWEAGLTWVFIQSFVLMIGGYIGPIIRKITPRAALLGKLAGVSITVFSMAPALQMFMTPVIGITCFAIILLSWFGGIRYGGIPAGLVAIAAGTVIAWGSTALGLNYGDMTLAGLTASMTGFGFHIPLPAFGHVFSGFQFLGT